jgi:hypothetical protein
MRDVRSVAATCGYVLTAEGREALREAEMCACEINFEGGLIVCRHCDTVYGLVRQMEMGTARPTLKRVSD